LKIIGLLLGTINEFWNGYKKRLLMICGSEVFAVKGLVMEAAGNNVADSGEHHFQGNVRTVSFRTAYIENSVTTLFGPDNA
jgi:hypothetical protein